MNKPRLPLQISRRNFLALAGATAALALSGRTSLLRSQSTASSAVANTAYGKVRGTSVGGVSSFLGIPYGGPADGANRFMPPTPATPWTGIRDCVKAGPRAMQTSTPIFQDHNLGFYFSGGRADGAAKTTEETSENCLVLNVLTPSLHGQRPVMVYIHGGGFATGSGALTVISDRFVAEEDIVLVGINHRLNAFGYTYLGDLDPKFADSGNVGQLDLVAALQWVKHNIAGFGGDPNNVTIFGESGGGAKVSCLSAMPSAKGLFHRAIVESGSARSVGSKEDATAATRKLLARLGISESNVADLLKVPADKFFAPPGAGTGGGMGGGRPIIDGRSIPHQTWTPDAPPEAAGLSMIIGNCKDESTLFAGLGNPELFNLSWDTLRAQETKAGIPDSAVDGIIAAYRSDYPKDSPSDLYFRMSSDRGARRNAIGQAESKLAQGDGQVFMYNFAWDTPVADGKLRAFHTSELPLAMRLVAYPQADALSKQIAGAWAAFARTGNPSHSEMPKWEPYTTATRATMVFDVANTRTEYNPAAAEMRLLQPYPGGLL